MPRTPENSDEIDFLMEQEYALEAALQRIQGRLGFLLRGIEESVEESEPRHLHIVSNPPDDVA